MKKLFLIFVVLTSYFELNAKINVENRVRDPFSVYQIGGREQRVRFFIANDNKYFTTSSSSSSSSSSNAHEKIKTDPARNFMRRGSYFGFISETPKTIGLEPFTKRDSLSFGLIVQPRLVLCAAKMLEKIERVSVGLEYIYEQWQIDEVNIFLYLTKSVDENQDYKLEIDPVPDIPKDPALNVQIPVETPHGKCMLPTDNELKEAIIEAHEEGYGKSLAASSTDLVPLSCNKVNYQDYIWSIEKTQKLIAETGKGCNLNGVKLREADLIGADLRWTNLIKADLIKADLIRADLIGAKLEGADLTAAKLQGAKLRGADLTGADLRVAKLQGADLRGVDLTRADLTGAYLRGADLRGANLRGAYLTRAYLEGLYTMMTPYSPRALIL